MTREQAGTQNIEDNIGFLRKYAEKAGVSVNDIGTSEEELKTLLTEGYTFEAKKWLRMTREQAGTQNIEDNIFFLRKYAEKAGVSVNDIGTSEEELKTLFTEGYTSEAKKRLQMTREQAGTQNIEDNIFFFRKYAQKAGVSVNDIGTSEEELKTLLTEG